MCNLMKKSTNIYSPSEALPICGPENLDKDELDNGVAVVLERDVGFVLA